MIGYEEFLNSNVSQVKPSGIRKFFDIANEMENVISLSIGEPDFKTPWHIRQEGIDSLEKGKTWYTPNKGFMDLCEEISKYYERKNNLKYDYKEEVLVTVGGSEAIDLCMRCILEKGDEVLIPQPSFVCYVPLAQMTGATPVVIETKVEDEFRITASQIESNITPKTKMIVLPFPNNPTGGIMRKEDLEEISKVILKHNLIVLSDEIYSELTYGENRHVSIAEIDGMKERTVIVNGFSKSYAMTGWRLGYALGPKEIVSQMIKLHQFAIMSAPTTAQYAAIEALKNGDDDIINMKKEYDYRRKYLVGTLNKMGLKCFEPKGAFYVFPSIQSTGLTSEEFCIRLIKEKSIAVVPGTAFGDCGEGFIRVSYSYSIGHIKEALKRIKEFISELE